MRYLFTLCIFSILLASCSKKDLLIGLDPALNESIEGSWMHAYYSDSLQILSASNKLKNDAYGFTFETNGTFKENKNAGGCGTPPITYKMYDGKWKRTSDSVFTIDTEFWGGEISFELRVISISPDTIKIHTSY
ncbi:MAG: hypothetical protein HN921_12855 [Bacteroidetes bacterium]|jgi:hypothetical protein|nr:hypothetical protein [Bacteroidota bacterium]MBT7040719.1 hypothetical protein [Bacteroidota bacterium]MBT7825254.1 hypothetical protein [Bacteroidota bacterium]